MSVALPVHARRASVERATRASGVAWKLARRELRRRPWRTVLVALLIAIPVGGMQVASTLLANEHHSAHEAWTARHGHADAVVQHDRLTDAARERLRAALPLGSSMEAATSAWTRVRTAEGRRDYTTLRTWVSADDLRDRVFMRRGRLPLNPDEAVLTRDVAERLGVDVGAVLRLVKPVEMTWKVVGTGDRRNVAADTGIQLGPGATMPTLRGSTTKLLIRVPGHVLTDRDREALIAASDAPAVEVAPWANRTSQVTEAEPESPSWREAGELGWTWLIGAIALLVLGIVIVGAFSASSRRQLVTLGQLGASGAPPPLLRRTMVLHGVGVGLVGAVLGSAFAAATLLGGREVIEELTGRQYRPYRVNLPGLIVPTLLGVLTAAAAASIPAKSVSRLPVLVSLAGRRPLTPVPRRIVVLGLTSCAVGTAFLGLAVAARRSGGSDGGLFTAVAVVGAATLLLGVCAVTPATVGAVFGRLGRVRGVRLAARSLARNRTRTSAAVSAVCATCALALVAASAMRSHSFPAFIDGRDDEVRVEAERVVEPVDSPEAGAADSTATAAPTGLLARLVALIPGSRELRLTRLASSAATIHAEGQSTGIESLLVADDVLLDAYPLTAEARAILQSDGAVIVAPISKVGVVRLGDESRTESGPAVRVVVTDAQARPHGPSLLVTPQTARSLRLPVDPVPSVVLRAPHPLTPIELLDIEDEVEDSRVAGPEMVWTRGPLRSSGTAGMPLEEILAGVALLITLAVIGGFMALSSAESRDERALLSVSGASPRTLWAMNGWSGVLIAVLGAAMAVPAGLVPLRVVSAAIGRRPFPLPWAALALLVAAVPAIIGVVTAALTAASLRLRPARPSTLLDE